MDAKSVLMALKKVKEIYRSTFPNKFLRCHLNATLNADVHVGPSKDHQILLAAILYRLMLPKDSSPLFSLASLSLSLNFFAASGSST